VRDLLKPENKQILRQVLTYHVVSGKVLASDLKSGELKSLQGDTISIKVNRNGVEVNDARVTKADIQGSNGVIHQIDNLILPPSI
ncbi:MAG: fasciclin domain-containing protein, partial [Dolichospermum sp.]